MMVPGVLAFGSLARVFAEVINLSFPDAPGRCEHLFTSQNCHHHALVSMAQKMRPTQAL
jgi:hypothetical protein